MNPRDAYADEIGHGKLGLRDRAIGFRQMRQNAAPQVFIEGWPCLDASTIWTQPGGANYWQQAFAEEDPDTGELLDVVSVEFEGITLRKCATIEEVDAQGGTFFYSRSWNSPAPGNLYVGVPEWDDGTHYDDGETRYDPGFLSVHLPDDADPNGLLVVVRVAFFFSNVGVRQPSVGPDEITNGDFEEVAGKVDFPVGWDFDDSGGAAVMSVLATGLQAPDSGLRYIAVEGSLSAGGASWAYQLGHDFRNGQPYLVYGSYRTYDENSTDFVAAIRVRRGGPPITGPFWTDRNGRDGQADTYRIALRSSPGEWRRFAFFLTGGGADGDGEIHLGAYSTSGRGGVSGRVDFDDVHKVPVYRWPYYRPCVANGGFPSREVGSNSMFPGVKRVGVGGLRMLNEGGAWQRRLAKFTWAGAPMFFRYGGIENDQEVMLHDTQPGWAAYVIDHDASDEEASFVLKDLWSAFQAQYPQNSYDRITFPDLEVGAEGRPRPYWFGRLPNVRPTRVARNSTTGLGRYELADTTNAPNQSTAIAGAGAGFVTVRVYETEDDADRENVENSVELFYPVDYDVQGPLFSQLWLLKNPGPFRVTLDENDFLDFTVDGVVCAARVDPGLYSAELLRTAAEGAMQTAVATAGVGGGTLSVSYSTSTHKFTISWSGSFLVLNLATGVHRPESMYGLMGYQIAKDFVIVAGVNDRLDFDIGGGALAAVLTPGSYAPTNLAAHVQTQMRAVGAGNENCVFDSTTRKITISKGAGTLNLRFGTGANLARSVARLIGYGATDRILALSYPADHAIDDRGGALSHAGDVSLLGDIDKTAVRVTSDGYLDDSSGTFTGTPDSVIERGSAVLHALVSRMSGIVGIRIDPASFAASFAGGKRVGVYIGGRASIKGGQNFGMTFERVIVQMEGGDQADVSLDGAGVLYYRLRGIDVPANVVRITNKDYIGKVRVRFGVDEVYRSMRINYAQDSGTGNFRFVVANKPLAALKFNRPFPRTIDTFLVDDSDAMNLAAYYARVGEAGIRRFEFTVRGLCLASMVGDIILISKDLMLGTPSGDLDSVSELPVRVLGLRVDWLTHEVKVYCATNIVGGLN